MPSINQTIYKIATKINGLTLQKDALDYLVQLYKHNPNLNQLLQSLFSKYKQTEDCPAIVTKQSLEKLINQQNSKESAVHLVTEMDIDESLSFTDINPYFKVIDAFNVPRWFYCHESRSFKSYSASKIFASAADKIACLKDRYDLIKQRILRNETFRPPSFQQLANSTYQKITPIKNLIGCSGSRFLLFGMLTQMQEGKYYLEDPDSFVELLFSQHTDIKTGLFCLNCFVLVFGLFNDNSIFEVEMISLPPNEPRNKSISAYGNNVDFFGAGNEIENIDVVKKIEKMADTAIVFLSDIWLDHPQVFNKLRTLFQGFAESPPLAFVFIGSFKSSPYDDDANDYIESFNQLSDLITSFPSLTKSTHFIFVPGPNDPNEGGSILPRMRVPDFFTNRIRNRIRNCLFTSNPCRIKYCTQEIVIFRENLRNRLRRNCIIPPNLTTESTLCQHYIQTIIDQSHLSPLPITLRPTLWGHDSSLRLYPTPDVLIMADSLDTFEMEYNGCKVMNPGVFSSEWKFGYYLPADGVFNEGQLPE